MKTFFRFALLLVAVVMVCGTTISDGTEKGDPRCHLMAPAVHCTAPRSHFWRFDGKRCVFDFGQTCVLYKENFGDNNSPWLLVIPTDLREEIFQACHDDPTSGHLGYSRTLARIREKYYWPKLPKTVHLYTRSCHECQRRKKPPTRPAGLLQPIAPPTAPFQQIGMDLLGPFPPSTSGNRWIIVATDYLTRYAETKALPSGTAVEVAKFFIESIVLRHGAPEVLITDRGSSFMAQLTQEILRLSHTSHRRTTAYHPQTNGLTERLNKTIADMISMYVDVEHKTWDEVLPYVTFAYNTAVQETTGVTPFQLVHGRKVTTMLDAMLPHEPAVDGSDDAQVVAQRAEEVRQLARLRIQAQQRVDAGRYNLRRRDVHFQPGDRVWVWTPIRRRGLSEKLLKALLWTLQSTSSTRRSELRVVVVSAGKIISIPSWKLDYRCKPGGTKKGCIEPVQSYWHFDSKQCVLRRDDDMCNTLAVVVVFGRATTENPYRKLDNRCKTGGTRKVCLEPNQSYWHFDLKHGGRCGFWQSYHGEPISETGQPLQNWGYKEGLPRT
ncbi:DDE-type integrase/transposase/recombinase [Ixodes scapularis]